VDGEFQEFEVTDEEFEHECVEDEDTSQGFVDWDSPPTYDEDVDEEDSIEEPLASVIEEEHEEDKFFPMFGGLYPNEDNRETRYTKIPSTSTKRLMKAFQVMCLIIMKKRLSILISLVLKIF
jgi:hypothetical protein